jgi:hypothetical protein
MAFALIHILTHLLVYVIWRYVAFHSVKNLVVKQNTLSSKGQIKVVLLLAGLPYTLAALIIILLSIEMPFEGARFIATFSYLIHSRMYISFLKKQGL